MVSKRNSNRLSFIPVLFVAILFALFFLSSCGKSGSVSPSSLNVQYQVVNLSPDLGAVDLYINFKKANTVSYYYPTPSGYFYLPSIDTPFQIRQSANQTNGTIPSTSNIFNFDNILKSNLKYTLFITGITTVDSVFSVLTVDTASVPTIGRGKVRFINASPRSAGFDVTANGTPAFSNQKYLTVSKYIELPAGTYDFKILPHGAQTIVNDAPNITIQDGKLYTFYCYGLLNHTDIYAFGTGIITNTTTTN